MAREMFGDVVKPSITVGSKQWYTLPLSILAHVAVIACIDCDSPPGGRRLADAAGDDGRVRGSATTAAASTSTTTAAAGRGAETGHGSEPVGRTGAGAFGHQA